MSTFAWNFPYICQDEGSSLTGKFGKNPNCKWRQWQYSQGIVIAQQVADFIRKLPGHFIEKTKRAKVTQFIAGKKSRQQNKPFVRKLCDKEVVEPLHLKNNGVQYLHTMLLHIAISLSNLPNKLTKCAIAIYIKAMKNDVKAGRM